MKYIDMHCDTISRLYELKKTGKEERLRENEGHLDLVRMKTGSCLAQNFALFTSLSAEKDPYGYCMALCDHFKDEIAANSGEIAQARTVEELIENEKAGKMSAVLTIEEGGVCCGDTEILRKFYEEGVRMMTLTWNYENELAYPNRVNLDTGVCVPELTYGLKKRGVEFVELMEELGMVVDVSHLGDAGFFDVAGILRTPFVASHSNARAVASHVRNLTDDMIRILAEHGGVAGINFCAPFLNDGERGKEAQLSCISDLILHIKHMKKVGGIECIGLGTDYDGIYCDLEIDSPAAFYRLYDALIKNGFTESEIEKIFYKNVLRVYKDVWKDQYIVKNKKHVKKM